jgi:2-phospho-L-lactate guanylyltransferase
MAVTGPGEIDTTWRVVVPVKMLDLAKTRLAPHLGVLRRDLALAMAVDTVSAAAASALVSAVVVVTDDVQAARAVVDAGARVVSDQPASGINAALRHGAVSVAGPSGQLVAALSADLPSLRPADLSAALAAAARWPVAYLADTHGTGTTMYAARSMRDFKPQFGAGSARAHATEAHQLDLDVPSLRRDVDTIDDLWAAVQLGVGVRTAELVRTISARSA